MNIVIVGCGNIGFETAKRLCQEHKLLLINRSFPDDLEEFVRNNDNVSFSLADATDQSSMEATLTKFDGKFSRVDVLISTVGAFCSTSALDDMEQFRSEFNLNLFGNLVPIQVVLERMLPERSGKIIVISSTSGVFAYPGLKAYVPAKWALTSFCCNLRDKIKNYGITIDIVFPASIRNRRSRTFLFENGIEAEKVANEIVQILKGKHNTNRFVPKRYALLHTLERLLPQVLDRRAGLKRTRKKLFRNRKAYSVLIMGASSELGKELAMDYAKTAKRLYICGTDERVLSELNGKITCSSDCMVDEIYLDLSDFRATTPLVERIKSVELIINNIEFPASTPVKDVPISDYELCMNYSLFGTVNLIVELLHKQKPPIKIINIIQVTTSKNRCRFDYHSAAQAALWAFTRTLRRTFGDKIQVTEVILTNQQENYPTLDATAKVESQIKYKYSRIRHEAPFMTQVMARRIHELESQGTEIVVIPLKYRLYMCLAAVLPWRVG
jgi:NAD(P)-dependent dehydrogenase (short-subunit alcohol dehydrogenase family)